MQLHENFFTALPMPRAGTRDNGTPEVLQAETTAVTGGQPAHTGWGDGPGLAAEADGWREAYRGTCFRAVCLLRARPAADAVAITPGRSPGASGIGPPRRCPARPRSPPPRVAA